MNKPQMEPEKEEKEEKQEGRRGGGKSIFQTEVAWSNGGLREEKRRRRGHIFL